MAYFVLHFIPGWRKLISQLVCNESAKISAFVVVCGGGCRCRRRQYSECLCYCPLLPGMLGCVASRLSPSEPEDLISDNLHGRSLQGPQYTILADTGTQYLVLGGFLYFICRSSVLVYRNYQIITH